MEKQEEFNIIFFCVWKVGQWVDGLIMSWFELDKELLGVFTA